MPAKCRAPGCNAWLSAEEMGAPMMYTPSYHVIPTNDEYAPIIRRRDVEVERVTCSPCKVEARGSRRYTAR